MAHRTAAAFVPANSRWLRALAWMLAAPALLLVAATLRNGFDLLDLPWETTTPEAYVLDGALRVAEGRVPYGRLHELPFVFHVYHPLTYVVPGALAALFRLDVHGTLVIGRCLSFACSILLAAVLCLTVARETGSRKLGLLAGVAPLFFHRILLTDFFRLRPESPSLLLTFTGVAIVLSGRRLPAAAVLFALAFLCKQTFFTAPLAAAIHLLLSGRRRAALGFCGALAALLAAAAAATAVWAGEAYVDSAIRALASNEVRPLAALRAQGGELVRTFGGVLLAAPVAFAALRSRRRHGFLVTYAVVCALWTLWSAGKVGAWLNYWSELGVLLVLVVALGAQRGTGMQGFLAAAVLSCIAGNALVVTIRDGFRAARPEILEPPRGDFAAYVERFRAEAGPRLISDERIAVHVRDPEVLDWVLLDELVKERLVDPSPLFHRIETGQYELVALERQAPTRIAQQVHRAVERGPYRRIWRGEPWNEMDVFVPRE